MSYVPSVEYLVSRLSPVEICTAVTFVWGRTRPEESVTVPLSPARSTCASEQHTRHRMTPTRRAICLVSRIGFRLRRPERRGVEFMRSRSYEHLRGFMAVVHSARRVKEFESFPLSCPESSRPCCPAIPNRGERPCRLRRGTWKQPPYVPMVRES